MTRWWDKDAADLSRQSKNADDGDIEIHFSAKEVRQSIVRTRQDVVLLVSHLSSANKQLRTISRFCFCILLVLIFILLKI